jgi:hypothetical protein
MGRKREKHFLLPMQEIGGETKNAGLDPCFFSDPG